MDGPLVNNGVNRIQDPDFGDGQSLVNNGVNTILDSGSGVSQPTNEL